MRVSRYSRLAAAMLAAVTVGGAGGPAAAPSVAEAPAPGQRDQKQLPAAKQLSKRQLEQRFAFGGFSLGGPIGGEARWIDKHGRLLQQVR